MPIAQQTHKLWNLWDEHALLMDIARLPGESNASLRDRILNREKWREDTTRQGMINAISSAMGYTQYNTRTKRVFYLAHRPYRNSDFIVTVAGVSQTKVDQSNYASTDEGYIVWKDENGEYTQILEFLSIPTYTRQVESRKHAGQIVNITYMWEDGDRLRTVTESTNPYDEDDDTFMGEYPEAEGTVKVHALNDEAWLNNPTHLMKTSSGDPTAKLQAIWREVDKAIPSSWGK